MEENELECSFCLSNINEDDDFCPECGSLFVEDAKCINHTETEAAGACVICCEPYCKECGFFVDDRIFLCNVHSEYEIYEGMVRIYGASDAAQIDYLKTCLEQSNLHPIVFSRKASPLHLGGSDYSLFRASGEFDGHIINEIKLMVPLQEVVESEKMLRQLNILQ
jgi:RNA polymerase subunit RPABC4/transcription elongation factor Spt4